VPGLCNSTTRQVLQRVSCESGTCVHMFVAVAACEPTLDTRRRDLCKAYHTNLTAIKGEGETKSCIKAWFSALTMIRRAACRPWGGSLACFPTNSFAIHVIKHLTCINTQSH